ncbi:RDD family protein [Bacillus marinisedimentorum]|uniref:RDD family protein n=1 Tax=Bacillus marinisedimentorum TaxID=1821260 RepID=UPI0007DFEB48|nr:RDD family protein [Bacillus marinisedimentorum]
MEYNPAGFWVRFIALIIDGIILSIAAEILNAALGLDVNVTEGERGVHGIIELLYAIIVPAIWAGYTIGKKATGIRIVKMDGSNVTFLTMLMRYLVGGIVYALTLGIGVIVSAFMIGMRSDKRAIHDFIAGTYVTRNSP